MGAIQILDGGLGTSLEDKYGYKFSSDKTPLWSSHLMVSHADRQVLSACQGDFAAAGADVLLTATYQASIEGFARTCTEEFPNGIPREHIGQYLKHAIDAAGKAATQGGAKREVGSTKRDPVQLALGLGPYGATMIPGQEYSGKYDAAHDTEDDLYRWHLERLRLFTDSEGLLDAVRYLAFETLPRIDEIRAVRRAVKAAGIDKDFWLSCVFPREDGALPDGSSIEHVVEAMLADDENNARPWGVGINCTKVHKLPGLVVEFERCLQTALSRSPATRAPTLVLYPDGTNGEVYNTTTQIWELPQDQSDAESNKVSASSESFVKT
jgi:homocysteine S-methyltransferase